MKKSALFIILLSFTSIMLHARQSTIQKISSKYEIFENFCLKQKAINPNFNCIRGNSSSPLNKMQDTMLKLESLQNVKSSNTSDCSGKNIFTELMFNPNAKDLREQFKNYVEEYYSDTYFSISPSLFSQIDPETIRNDTTMLDQSNFITRLKYLFNKQLTQNEDNRDMQLPEISYNEMLSNIVGKQNTSGKSYLQNQQLSDYISQTLERYTREDLEKGENILLRNDKLTEHIEEECKNNPNLDYCYLKAKIQSNREERNKIIQKEKEALEIANNHLSYKSESSQKAQSDVNNPGQGYYIDAKGYKVLTSLTSQRKYKENLDKNIPEQKIPTQESKASIPKEIANKFESNLHDYDQNPTQKNIASLSKDLLSSSENYSPNSPIIAEQKQRFLDIFSSNDTNPSEEMQRALAAYKDDKAITVTTNDLNANTMNTAVDAFSNFADKDKDLESLTQAATVYRETIRAANRNKSKAFLPIAKKAYEKSLEMLKRGNQEAVSISKEAMVEYSDINANRVYNDIAKHLDKKVSEIGQDKSIPDFIDLATRLITTSKNISSEQQNLLLNKLISMDLKLAKSKAKNLSNIKNARTHLKNAFDLLAQNANSSRKTRTELFKHIYKKLKASLKLRKNKFLLEAGSLKDYVRILDELTGLDKNTTTTTHAWFQKNPKTIRQTTKLLISFYKKLRANGITAVSTPTILSNILRLHEKRVSTNKKLSLLTKNQVNFIHNMLQEQNLGNTIAKYY